MAVEVFPDSPTVGVSPRISFSHDLSQSDAVPVERYIRNNSSSIDFDFCVFRESFDQESSSADELFSDGKILPIEVKKRLAPPKSEEPPPAPRIAPSLPPPPPQRSGKFSSNVGEMKSPSSESEEKQQKSWFKRSSSLNCGSGYGRTLCPLPLLSRSNSTGSSGSGKRSSVSSSQKQSFLRHNSSNSSQKQQGHQSGYSSKPPLKKNINFSYGNGVKFSPVLNVPTASFFGLGSIFSGGKDRSRKKY